MLPGTNSIFYPSERRLVFFILEKKIAKIAGTEKKKKIEKKYFRIVCFSPDIQNFGDKVFLYFRWY